MNVKKYNIWTVPIADILSDIKPGDKAIIYAAEEYEVILDPGSVDSNSDISWVFGGGDIDFYRGYPGKIILWHNFYMYNSFISLDKRFYSKSKQPTKIFISMNHRAHTHRCILMDMLAKYKMINKGFISWKGVQHADYKFNYWNPKKSEFNDGFLTKYGMHILPFEYSYALVNLISESTTRTIFVTEKTYNSIFAEKPFIIQGPTGIHRHLRDMGFELYDEIFDYDFDSMVNDVDRTEAIVQNLKSLENSNLQELKKLLSPKAKRNKKRALSIIKNKEYVPEEVYGSEIYCTQINESISRIKK